MRIREGEANLIVNGGLHTARHCMSQTSVISTRHIVCCHLVFDSNRDLTCFDSGAGLALVPVRYRSTTDCDPLDFCEVRKRRHTIRQFRKPRYGISKISKLFARSIKNLWADYENAMLLKFLDTFVCARTGTAAWKFERIANKMRSDCCYSYRARVLRVIAPRAVNTHDVIAPRVNQVNCRAADGDIVSLRLDAGSCTGC
ncbi:hypothetical protein EVAR_18934_1 [Eumeta japonica]|uniref:Uncharacterized protein n=1 Tax=Eumeta variegata TaxID=151549 RepID=A0A4C1V1W4_EUMVA|nr:hypothetical protein EVAR_18934_1 [Eumeta japonica]